MFLRTLVIGLLLITGHHSRVNAETLVHRDDLKSIFQASGVQGSFAVLDVQRGQLVLVNAERAHQRRIPASTFKIANSLIALELGVVADENEVVSYGGQSQPVKAWEQDMSIRQAIKVSNVPVFQNLARQIGLQRYRAFLRKLSYGNGSVGSDVTSFWLKGPLRISPVEQTRFLADLATNNLPVSNRTQDIVRDILLLENKGTAQLHGKTGWTTTPDPDLGWFVGWVERGAEVHAFALNIDMRSRQDAKLREGIAHALLDELGVF